MSISSKTVISSIIWKLLERISTQLVSFIISIILARILMPDDYGVIAIILVFINLANVFIDGGLNTALIQKKDADQIDFSTIFWFCLFISAVLYGLLYFGAPFVSSFYGNEILTPTLRVLGISVIFNSFNSIQRAYVSRHMLFKKLFYVNAIVLVMSGGLGVVMAFQGYGVWSLVGQSLAVSVFCCIFMWFTIRWRPTFEISLTKFKGLFDYGWKIFITNFIIAIYNDIRSIVIGKMYQPSVLGFFDRGRSIPQLIMSNLLTSINTVLLPAFADEQNDRVRVKQMMRRSVQVGYLFIAPLLVGLFFASKELVLVLLTEKWMPAVPFIQIFCLAFFLMPIQNVNITAIQSLGYSGIILKLEIYKKIIEAVILIVSFMINVYAVAWGVVLYNFICVFINLRPSKQLLDYGVCEQVRDILPTLIAALLMGGVIYACGFLPLGNLFILVLQIIIGAAIYYLLCKIFNLDSYHYVLNYVKNALK